MRQPVEDIKTLFEAHKDSGDAWEKVKKDILPYRKKNRGLESSNASGMIIAQTAAHATPQVDD